MFANGFSLFQSSSAAPPHAARGGLGQTDQQADFGTFARF
jgi:hypothetical protein